MLKPLKACPPYLQKYVNYLNNTGRISIDAFDDDWFPIGPDVRDDMKALGLIHEVTEADMIYSGDGQPWMQPEGVGISLRPDLKHDYKQP